jgi:hypothetical protein
MRDLKKYGPYAIGAAALGGIAYYVGRKSPNKKAVMGGLDGLGADEAVFVGKGGGGGHGGGHGGHGHGGRGWGGGGWWGGGPYYYGPLYDEGIEIADDWTPPPPTAEEIAEALAQRLGGHGGR